MLAPDLVDRVFRAVRAHPSYIRPIPAAARPALLRAILRAGLYPAGNEVPVTVYGKAYVAQVARRDHTTDSADRVFVWAEGWSEAVEGLADGYVMRDISGDLPRSATQTYQRRPLSAVRYVTVHHTVTPATHTPEMIAAFHVGTRRYPGIAYHVVVGAAGEVWLTQPLEVVSWHDTVNRDSVGVALVGDFTQEPPPPAQLAAAAWAVSEIERRVGRPLARRPHHAVSETACPGRTWNVWASALGAASAAGERVDVWRYMCGGVVAGWGRPYMLERLRDGQRVGMERVQVYVERNVLYITKNRLVEVYRLDGDVIRQVLDTSPEDPSAGSEPVFYEVVGGGGYAPRWMLPGEVWYEPELHQVVFRRMRDGSEYGSPFSGQARNVTRLGTVAGDAIDLLGGVERHRFRLGYSRVMHSDGVAVALLSADDPGDWQNEIVLPVVRPM